MSAERPKPDISMLKQLYDFGGLMAYQVSYFDTSFLRVETGEATFSKEHAERELEQRLCSGLTAWLSVYMVKFDGAFALPQANNKGVS